MIRHDAQAVLPVRHTKHAGTISAGRKVGQGKPPHRTWNGRTEEGLRFVQEIAPDGTVAFRSPSASMIGMASIEDDRLCLQYPGFLLGRRHCGLVYRHAQEAPGENGQYVYVNVDTIKYFSVAP